MGYFHPACVVHLHEGDIIAPGGDVLAAQGKRRPARACMHTRFDPDGRPHVAGQAPAATAAAFNGWLAYSSADPSNTPPALAMSARWTVPAAPAVSDGQTLFFFPGLETSPNSDSILQPVLAWDGEGEAAWTMTGWNCCIQGTVYEGTSISVSAGDTILGTMVGSSCSANGVCSNWQIESSDLTNGRSTTFSTSAYGQAFNWYFGGVMEVYGVASCAEFPASGQIVFNRVLVADQSANPVTPAWTTTVSDGAPPCGFVVDTSATRTRIRFSPN